METARLNTPVQVGSAIRSARNREGLTQVELAQRAGVSRRWLIALEQGHARRAELGKVLDTLDALDLSLTVGPAVRDSTGLAHLLEEL